MATENTAIETNPDAHTFRLVAGAVMVLLIMFGLLELMNVVHI